MAFGKIGGFVRLRGLFEVSFSPLPLVLLLENRPHPAVCLNFVRRIRSGFCLQQVASRFFGSVEERWVSIQLVLPAWLGVCLVRRAGLAAASPPFSLSKFWALLCLCSVLSPSKSPLIASSAGS